MRSSRVRTGQVGATNRSARQSRQDLQRGSPTRGLGSGGTLPEVTPRSAQNSPVFGGASSARSRRSTPSPSLQAAVASETGSATAARTTARSVRSGVGGLTNRSMSSISTTPSFFRLDEHKRKNVEKRANKARARRVIKKLQASGGSRFARTRDMFRAYDDDKSGFISQKEFNDVLVRCNLHLEVPESDVAILFNTIDDDQNDAISYDEFCQVFDGRSGGDEALFTPSTDGGDVEDAMKMGSETERKALHGGVEKIKTQLVEHLNRGQNAKSKHRSDGQFLLQGFQKFDVNMDGFLTYKEFRNALGPKGMNLDVDDIDIQRLIQVVDRNGSGCITAKEFLKALAVVDMTANPFGPGGRDREIASLTRIAERTSPVLPQSASEEDGEYPPLTRFSRMARKYYPHTSEAELSHRDHTVPNGPRHPHGHSHRAHLSPEHYRPSSGDGVNQARGIAFRRTLSQRDFDLQHTKQQERISRSKSVSPHANHVLLSSPGALSGSRHRDTNVELLHELSLTNCDELFETMSLAHRNPITRSCASPPPVHTGSRVGFGSGGVSPDSALFISESSRFQSTNRGAFSHGHSPIQPFSAEAEAAKRREKTEVKAKIKRARESRILKTVAKESERKADADFVRMRYLSHLKFEEERATAAQHRVKGAMNSPFSLRQSAVSVDSMFA